jgi:hypothetical protein
MSERTTARRKRCTHTADGAEIHATQLKSLIASGDHTGVCSEFKDDTVRSAVTLVSDLTTGSPLRAGGWYRRTVFVGQPVKDSGPKRPHATKAAMAR